MEPTEVDPDATWWCIKAGRGGVLEDDWLQQSLVSTGWGNSGGDFREVDCNTFRENDPSDYYQLSKFVGCGPDEMKEGDIVIAYAPNKGHVSGIGAVGEIHYDEELTFHHVSEEEAREYKVQDHYYWRPVTWFDLNTPVLVSDLPPRFQVQGADQLPTPPTLNQYGSLSSDRDRIESLIEAVQNAETVDASGEGFGPELESQIHDWVFENVSQLGLTNPRREVRTSVGKMDLVADSEDGEQVIEIKRGRAGDKALGQLLGYVGAYSEETGEEVHGKLIAEGFTPRVRAAVKQLPNISLHEFKVETTLRAVET